MPQSGRTEQNFRLDPAAHMLGLILLYAGVLVSLGLIYLGYQILVR
jgi:hypothetical protein